VAVVKTLGVFYTALITIAVVGSITTTVTLYHSGSASISGWASFFQPGLLSAKHAFLVDQCEACHTPIRGVKASTCITCHSTAAADLGKQPTAFHANIQDCRGCHIEHQGGTRLIKMDHGALLKIGSHIAVDPGAHPSVPRQMMTDIANFLGVQGSQTNEKNGLVCASCHSNRDPHRELFGRDCANCHDTPAWRIEGFLHPSPTSRDCAQCHQGPPSHYMMHFEMVSKMVARQEHAQVNQCFLCHQTNSWNDIRGTGWYKHH